MLEGTWPLDLLEDPSKQARVVHTAHEFLREVLIGSHLEEVVVLPNGTELLGLREEDCLPPDLSQALDGCATVADFLRRIRGDDDFLQKYKAGVEYLDRRGEQCGVLPKERRNLRGRVEKALSMVEEGKADPALLYVAEMRLQKEQPHPIGGDRVKTVCLRDVKDVLGPYSAWALYWDRHDEGVFVGSNRSGKGVHIDQVLWSNIGKNWRGYKLLASWPKGEVSAKVARNFDDRLFTPPLTNREVAALRQASKVVLVRPGDVYVFSGGTAHTVLCASDGIALGGYESIVPLHHIHGEMFLQTCDKGSPLCIEGSMPEDEFNDVLDEVLDQLDECARQLRKGGVPGVECAPPARDAQDLPPRLPSPSCWEELRRGLASDPEVRSALLAQYARAVSLCHRGSRYLQKRMSRAVIDARRKILDEEGEAHGDKTGRSGSRSHPRSRSPRRCPRSLSEGSLRCPSPAKAKVPSAPGVPA